MATPRPALPTRVLIAFRPALTHMISAMAFPWESLIAAAAGVIGGIGGAGVTGYLANKREEAAADRLEDAAEEARRRDAYASLLIASRAALRNFRQLRLAYSADTPDVPEVTDVVAQSSTLASEMNQAAALAELVGSDDVRQRARAVYEKAKTCAEFYQERSIGLAGLDKVLGTRGLPHRFDAEQAERLCDDLATSIDAFADMARDEVLGALYLAPAPTTHDAWRSPSPSLA